jgi:hypothetical protein
LVDSPYTGIVEGEVFFLNGIWPPDIKRNCVPAPEISFTRPDLPVLVREAEELAKA